MRVITYLENNAFGCLGTFGVTDPVTGAYSKHMRFIDFNVVLRFCKANVWVLERHLLLKDHVFLLVIWIYFIEKDTNISFQAAKLKLKEEQEKRLLEQRAQYIEKTKSLLVFDAIIEDKPSRGKGGRVSTGLQICKLIISKYNAQLKVAI